MHRTTLVRFALITCLVTGWLLSGSFMHAQEPTIVRVQLNTTLTYKPDLLKGPIVNVRVPEDKVVQVLISPTDLSSVLITGLTLGNTKVTLTDAQKNTQELSVFVTLDDARKRFLETARFAFPTANIDIIPAPNNTVLLTGHVREAADVGPIIDVAKGHFGIATKVINKMTLPGVQLVQLNVVIARVNRSEARNLTWNFSYRKVDWFIGSVLKSPLASAAAVTTGLPAATGTLAVTGAGNIPFGVLTPNHGVTGFLEALRTEGLAKIHTEPTIVTLSGKPGYIISGGETPILTSAGQGSPSVTYKQFGTVVNFLPIVLGDGKIHLEVRPEVSQLDTAAGLFVAGVTPTSVPGFAIRSAQAAAVLEDGQTLAIGGIVQTTQDTTLNKVPIIGDLPYVGHFFRTHSSRETEEELLILVTPRLVHPMDCTQLPKYLPGRETRTPDDFELFLEGILEAPRGQREINPAAHLVSPTAGMYPCGDGSCGIGGRFCGRLGCRSCGSVIHTQPAAMPQPPAVPPKQPLNLPPNVPGVAQGFRPAGLPVDEPIYVVQPTEKTAPQAITPVSERPTHATPIPPREVPPDWQNQNPGNLVPPVSELRRDLN